MKVKTWNSAQGVHKVKCEVEDHGNGFMVVGTNMPEEARKILTDYVDDVAEYAFACPTHYDGRSATWLSTAPLENWDGSKDFLGNPLPR